MKAVIMAGGRGTRIAALAGDLPNIPYKPCQIGYKSGPFDPRCFHLR